MPTEALSTARPSPLRLAGFLCLAAGALLAGIGSTREWAAVGFLGDLERALDTSWRGTDVWEGKVVLLGAFLALLGMVAMRLAPPAGTRRAIAMLVIPLGLICAALPLVDAARAEARFGGEQGADRLVAEIAGAVGQPEEVVREQFREELEADLRVDLGPGVWMTVGGGLLLIAGGFLSFALVRRRGQSDRPPP